MSSTLRLSIIMVLLFASAALGLIAYNLTIPKPAVQALAAAVTQDSPAQPAQPALSGYFVASHPLPAGTLAREEDFIVRSVAANSVPSEAMLDTPDVRIGLRGSLVRTFIDTGGTVTSQNVLRPRERGFLASVLTPGTRAVSINVNAASGVSGLIWPGDYVDVILTLKLGVSETLLNNVRIIAIDQEIMQGVPVNNATAGKETHTVSLQLAPEQVEKITAAQDLGRLSLAARAVEQPETMGSSGTVSKSKISPEPKVSPEPRGGFVKVYRGTNGYSVYRCVPPSVCDKVGGEGGGK
jgi:pilus assembly protein CpaB